MGLPANTPLLLTVQKICAQTVNIAVRNSVSGPKLLALSVCLIERTRAENRLGLMKLQGDVVIQSITRTLPTTRGVINP